MGRLIKNDNFLSKYGFQYGVNSGPCGESGYTNTFLHKNGSECLWVTVNFRNKKVYFYNEFECGGVLSQYTINIPEIVIDNENEFIKWLDNYLPDEM